MQNRSLLLVDFFIRIVDFLHLMKNRSSASVKDSELERSNWGTMLKYQIALLRIIPSYLIHWSKVVCSGRCPIIFRTPSVNHKTHHPKIMTKLVRDRVLRKIVARFVISPKFNDWGVLFQKQIFELLLVDSDRNRRDEHACIGHCFEWAKFFWVRVRFLRIMPIFWPLEGGRPPFSGLNESSDLELLYDEKIGIYCTPYL